MSKKNKVLVTGAGGFIGSHLVDTCAKQNHEVWGIDNLSRRGTQFNLNYLNVKHEGNFKFHKLDLVNLNKLEVFFQNNGPFDWIAHEAGQVAVTTSLISPVDDFKSNTVATINLLESVRKYSPDAKVVYASTNKVYGKLTNLEIRELKNKYSFLEGFKGVSEEQPLDFQSPTDAQREVQTNIFVIMLDLLVLKQRSFANLVFTEIVNLVSKTKVGLHGF